MSKNDNEQKIADLERRVAFLESVGRAGKDRDEFLLRDFLDALSHEDKPAGIIRVEGALTCDSTGEPAIRLRVFVPREKAVSRSNDSARKKFSDSLRTRLFSAGVRAWPYVDVVVAGS